MNKLIWVKRVSRISFDNISIVKLWPQPISPQTLLVPKNPLGPTPTKSQQVQSPKGPGADTKILLDQNPTWLAPLSKCQYPGYKKFSAGIVQEGPNAGLQCNVDKD